MNAEETNGNDKFDKRILLSTAFSPATPITKADLFAKRGNRMDDLIEVVMQPGEHAVLYGERGVGKTSFVSVMAEIYGGHMITARTNCASGESFQDIWRHVFDSIRIISERTTAGFSPDKKKELHRASEMIDVGNLGPNDVRAALERLTAIKTVVVFIDEFDRVKQSLVRRKFADTIKALSDYGVRATIVIVGVADNVGELISEHESISRALAQLHLPRMETAELREIIANGMSVMGMSMDDLAAERIVMISRGLPHYTHALGLHASYAAVLDERDRVMTSDVEEAVARAIDRAQERISSMYETAVWSTRDTNYEEVLLACALAPVDDRGYFAPSDVRAPMTKIMQRRYEIPNFIGNLNQLSTPKRGPVLQKTGMPRGYRYRFVDPLLQPYIVMLGISRRLVDYSDIVSVSRHG